MFRQWHLSFPVRCTHRSHRLRVPSGKSHPADWLHPPRRAAVSQDPLIRYNPRRQIRSHTRLIPCDSAHPQIPDKHRSRLHRSHPRHWWSSPLRPVRSFLFFHSPLKYPPQMALPLWRCGSFPVWSVSNCSCVPPVLCPVTVKILFTVVLIRIRILRHSVLHN